MASDERLHPASILFSLATHAKELLLPGLAAFFVTIRSGEWGWQAAAMVLFVPYSLVSIARWFSYRYRLEHDELVIRTGLVFRSVRHIPYNRIHNIDAVQNVLHRLFGVAEVRIETGGGRESEARIQVLGAEAVREMRRRILAGREGGADTAVAAPPDDVVLALTGRDLWLCGLIQNKGLLLVSGLLGLLWEFGLVERTTERLFGEGVPGRGVLRQVALALVGRAEVPVAALVVAAAAFVALLVALRLLSGIWALVSLHGYTLVRQEGALRAQFGLLTRTTATTPLGRIQCVTVDEGPLHRFTRRASVRVQTAGDVLSAGEPPLREVVAPIVAIGEVPALLATLQPGFDAAAMAWHPPHPRAFRRALVGSLATVVILTFWLAWMLQWWWFALEALLVAWAMLHARMYVRHLRWGISDSAIGLRTGWLWRRTSIASLDRVQAVSMSESPFDRRHGMAGVLVDTFGARTTLLDIPYLGRATARGLSDHLIRRARSTPFRP
jgi:putative membrane protein